MDEQITRDDLRQFGMLLVNEIKTLLSERPMPATEAVADPEWLKSGKVRKMLDMSPATLQNLRIQGKVRFKKVLGSYYYNRTDLNKLFADK